MRIGDAMYGVARYVSIVKGFPYIIAAGFSCACP